MYRPLVVAAATLLSLAHARITGIAVPDTIKPGDTFDAIIHSESYIQSVFDVAIVFGYAPGDGYPESLGVVANSICLGKGALPINPLLFPFPLLFCLVYKCKARVATNGRVV